MHFDAPGTVTLSGISAAYFIFVRTSDDWGWYGMSMVDGSLICSIDRRPGRTYCRLAYDAEGKPREVQPLISPLKDVPTNGLYIAT
jgi:hypothetical protein